MTARHSHPGRPARGATGRRLSALLCVLAVSTVPPVVLLALVGNPLNPPGALRGPSVLSSALDDRSLLWLLALVVWLLWAHLLGSFTVELARQSRGSTLRMPLPGLLFGANTALASHLIASLLLSGPSLPHSGLTPAVARTAVTGTAALAPVGFAGLLATGSREAATGTPLTTREPSALIECRVLPPQGRDHDTLWDIAERHLRDGTRWREVYALNEGRVMPDGHRLTRASLIHPGWILRLPADAVTLDGDRVTPAPAGTSAVTSAVTSGVSPPGTSPSSPGPAQEPPGTDPASPAPELPDRTEPAPLLNKPVREQPATHPAIESAAPTGARGQDLPGPPGATTPLTTPATTPQADHPAPRVGSPLREDDTTTVAPAVTVSLLGLAALGLLQTLTRRRRIAARRRPLGVRTARPTQAMRDLEAQLRQQARVAEDTVATVQLALLLVSRHAPTIRLCALWQHPDGSIELVLTNSDMTAAAQDVPAPAPFTTTDRGWLLSASNLRFLFTVKQDGLRRQDRDARLAEELCSGTDPFPLLLPVGSHDGSACLVNLELFGLVSLVSDAPATGTAADGDGDGDETAVTAAASAMIAAWVQALACAPWSDLVRTYVPDTLAASTTGLERLQVLDPASEDLRYARAELTPDEQQIVDRLDSLEQGRRTDPRVDLVHLSVWAGYTAAQLPDPLVQAALDPRDPNSVLLLGPHPAAHTWRLTRTGQLHIPGVAEPLVPLALHPDQQDLVLRLLEHAEDPPHAAPDAPDRAELLADCPPLAIPLLPVDMPNDADVLDLPALAADTEVSVVPRDAGVEIADAVVSSAPEVAAVGVPTEQSTSAGLPQPLEINILGPLQIHGGHGDPPRRQCLELLVYLTLHRRPVPVETLWQAVYPGRAYDSHQLVNRVHELRGYARQKLPQVKKCYQVDEFTISDWQRFQALADGNPTQQLEALALVRGRPFEDLRGDWIHLEGQLPEIEASIVDLALAVGERALRGRDPGTARTAALAGLRGCPWDERLYRLGMQSAAARGATHEIHQLRKQLQRVLDDELDPDDDIQPATEELYTALREEQERQRRIADRRRNGA